jgi:hypothetical protein
MVAKPDISVTAGEPRSDVHGQSWSPATVALSWPDANDLPGPSIAISVVAPIREQMTVDELRTAHIQAAHEVLNASLLSLEEAPYAKRIKQQSRQR